VWCHPEGVQGVFDFIGQFFSRQVQGRAIHRDFEFFAIVAGQLAQVLAGLAQHPVVQLGDQAVRFGNGDEPIGREQSVNRMLPANQRFKFGDLADSQVINRLVIQHQPGVFAQGVTQFFFELQLQGGSGFQV